MTEEELIKKLLKIEALHSGAQTAGEKLSAFNAKERILKKKVFRIEVHQGALYKYSSLLIPVISSLNSHSFSAICSS